MPPFRHRENTKVLLLGMLDHLNKKIRKRIKPIEQKVKRLVRDELKQSEGYGFALGEGSHLLGLDNVEKRLSAIIQFLADTVRIEFTPFHPSSGNSVRGKFRILGGSTTDFSDGLLDIPEATVTSSKGNEWNYLRHWLLLGDQTIMDYTYVAEASGYEKRHFSRTGHSIMRQKKGASWRMPPEHAGFQNRNWIYDCLNSQNFENKLDDTTNFYLLN